VAYYSTEKKTDKPSLAGLRRRLNRLERALQDLPPQGNDSRALPAVTPKFRIDLGSVVNAIAELHSAIPASDIDLMRKPPLSFPFPELTSSSLTVSIHHAMNVRELFETLEKELPRIQERRKVVEKGNLLWGLFPKRREEALQRLRTRELNYARLFNYRRVLEQTAETITNGGWCNYPEIVRLRALIAAKDAAKERDLRIRLFSPVPPSPQEVMKARVASADKKSREAVASLRDKVPRTTDCPYCEEPIPEKGYHLDHIVPVKRGGLSAIDNLIYICIACNQKKRDLGLMEFARQNGIAIEPLIDRLHKMGKRY